MVWRNHLIIGAVVISLSLLGFPTNVSSEIHGRSALQAADGRVEDGGLEEEAVKIIRKAFEDNSWLNLSTEKELKSYCETIFSPETAEDMALRLSVFLEGNDDWHTVARVCSIEEIWRTADEIGVRVSIEYYDLNFSDGGEVIYLNSGTNDFIVLLKREENSFRIKWILKDDNRATG